MYNLKCHHDNLYPQHHREKLTIHSHKAPHCMTNDYKNNNSKIPKYIHAITSTRQIRGQYEYYV